jgi:hypothetical protein
MPQLDVPRVLARLPLTDKFTMLRKLAPLRAAGLELLLDEALRETWPRRTPVWIKARLRPRLVKRHA